MKIDRYKPPKSSFLSVDKDIVTIKELFINNERLCRLLFRTNKDPLNAQNLTQDEKIELFEKRYIRNVPKVIIDEECLNYVVINFTNFIPNATNTEFRDNAIVIEIICHYDQWQIKDGMLRPYRIAGEIDSMLNEARLSGIGVLNFIGAEQVLLTPEYGGIHLTYLAVHGEDDKIKFANPADEEKFLEEFVTNVL